MTCPNKRTFLNALPAIEHYRNIPPRPDRIGGRLRVRGEFRKKSEDGKPLVSIITVVFNGVKNIEQTIKSVLNQTYDNIEYIIIDGGSADGTLDIIRKYEDVIDYWASEPDNGIYDAMNKGIALAAGELINLLNADDFLEPGAVESAVRKYLEFNRACIIYGNAYEVDDAYSVKTKMSSTSKYWLGMTVNHQSMFVHRNIYDSIGLYDSVKYRYAADYDLLVRCFRNNVSFVMVEDYIVNYRNAGISSAGSNHRKEANLINRKHFCLLSRKRLAFILFNYIWMPFKINARIFLYKTIGVKTTRDAITIYKKMLS